MKKKIVFILLLLFTQYQVNAQSTEAKQALLVIDIQNDYFDGGASPLVGSHEASLNAQKLLTAFRKDSQPIIFIQHISTYDGATFFIPNTEGVKIHQNVKPMNNEIVITKNYPNSFKGTTLLETLKKNKITKLVICGMMTHMCVDATVRAAKDLGYECTLISDACATKDLEIKGKKVSAQDVQTAFLSALNYAYSTTLSTDEFLSTH